MQQFLGTEALIIGLLLVASLVAILVRRLQVPYTVVLVLAGLLLGSQSAVKFTLTPELILALFVPPLIFEAAFHLNLSNLRRTFPAILVLAVPGVVLTMLIVAGILTLGVSISLPVALVFGALIAATDPVAVVAIFRLLNVPKQLAVLVEGESLFNDGTALVLFTLMLVVDITGKFNLLQSGMDFIRISVGGVVVGLVLGWLIAQLIGRFDDYLIETTLTTVLAYGAYLVADQLQFSGVLAVVAAGLVNGNLGSKGMSPTTRIVIFNFWEYAAFLSNSLIFLLIGLQINLPVLLESWQPILWAIGAVLASRIVVVYGLSWIINRFKEPISLRWQHILAWGGLRGALSLALALSLPEAIGPDRMLLQTMAFGVVLFTLLVQATTMRPLVRWLGIIDSHPAQVEYEFNQAELTAMREVEAHLQRRYREGLLSAQAWEKIRPNLQKENANLARMVREILRSEPTLETAELKNARKEIQRVKRSVYLGLRSDGAISDTVYDRLIERIDADQDEQRSGLSETDIDAAMMQEESVLDEQLELREVVVEPGSSVEGHQVRHIPWPEDFVIARVQRNSQKVFARGNTVLQAGDILVTVASEVAFQEALGMCQTRDSSG